MSKVLKKDSRKLGGGTSKAARGIGGQTKRFSRATFELTKQAVSEIVKHLEARGIRATLNDDRYGPDIVVWKGFKPDYYIEVAQRSAWKGGEWNTKWDPIHLEERKLHLWKLTLPCQYWIVSGDHQVALVATHSTVASFMETVVEVSNRVIRNGERFAQIPLWAMNVVYLQDTGGKGDGKA